MQRNHTSSFFNWLLYGSQLIESNDRSLSSEARCSSNSITTEPDTFDEDSIDQIDADFALGVNDYHYNHGLASGTFTHVYKGTWNNIQVAIKVSKNADCDSKIENEIKIYERIEKARMKHPQWDYAHHVLHYYGNDATRLRATFVVEFMNKGTLDNIIYKYKNSPPLPWHTLGRSLAKDMVKGLIFLHRIDILHRDLKPANIFVEFDAYDGLTAKLGDFNLSERGTSGFSQVGTPLYSAPEILSIYGGHYSQKSDNYSMAYCINEIMTRVPIFIQYNLNSLTDLRKLVIGKNKRPMLASNCSQTMRFFFNRAWHENPEQRFKTPTLLRILNKDEEEVLRKNKVRM